MVARPLGWLAVASLCGCQLPGPLALGGDAGTSGGSSGAGSSGAAASSSQAASGSSGSSGASGSSGNGSISSSSGSSSSSASNSGGSTSSSSSGGNDGGEAPYGSDGSTEYQPCASAADCTPPEQCTTFPGLGSLCLIPCTGYLQCHDDETCTFGYCIPNFCGPGHGAAAYYGSCAATDQGAGICVPYDDPYPPAGPVGICFAAGTVPLDGSCTPNLADSWNIPRSELCSPPGLCVPAGDGGAGTCTQGCDPSDTLDAGACAQPAVCFNVPGYDDPYLGLCL